MIFAAFNNLYKYRSLVTELVIRDLKLRYRRSFLGYLWSLLNPLLMMVIITIVFSTLFRFDIPNYPVYLLCGQIMFNFFSEATTSAMGSVLGNGALIKKIYIPKFIFPISKVLSSLVNFVFSLAALALVMLVTGIKPTLYLLLLPIPVVMLMLLATGVGFLLSVVVVYFRDMNHIYSILLTALMYLCPIFYPISILPEWFASKYLIWNPMYHIITIFRDCVLYGRFSDWVHYEYCIGFILIFNIVGVFIFAKKIKRAYLHL